MSVPDRPPTRDAGGRARGALVHGLGGSAALALVVMLAGVCGSGLEATSTAEGLLVPPAAAAPAPATTTATFTERATPVPPPTTSPATTARRAVTAETRRAAKTRKAATTARATTAPERTARTAARATVASTTTLPTPVPPPPDPDAYEETILLGAMAIPEIGLEAPLLEGIRLMTLDQGPGHWPGSAMPGEPGNVVVAGHRVSHGGVFRYIDTLVEGDELVFHTDTGTHTYRVTSTEVVGPDALWIVDPTPTPTATLFACHPPGSVSQRIVVKAELVT